MRKQQLEALEAVERRCDLSEEQMRELSLLISSTHGPLIIGSFIENGLKLFRTAKKEKKSRKRKP